MNDRLRLVVFTAGPLSPLDRTFYERLARDPLVDLRAIIVDQYVRPRRPLLARIRRGLRQDGWGWLWFKAMAAARGLGIEALKTLFEKLHVPAREESYAVLTRDLGVLIHHVADIHGDEGLSLIHSLRPQLGVIVGGRILSDGVISIAEYGTLNIHKRRVPDYRGSGPIGYWEMLAGESSIGITIHYATSKVDAGDVVAEATIPIEECDTLASLRIKADLVGARLYHEAICKVARGDRKGTPQGDHERPPYRQPSEYRVYRLEKELQRRARRRMPFLSAQPGTIVRTRVLLQYALLLPLLTAMRRRFARERRSPVSILFYHLVANRPLNHMCLPLEDFVRQMEFLRRYYRLVILREAIERLQGCGGEDVTVAITFDDGYRDNTWAIEYMRSLGIPAAFFISIGHVLDGSRFEHDLRRGFKDALPMQREDVQRLAAEGFMVGSHGLHHEDLGALDPSATERVLAESSQLLAETLGSPPESFSFPWGHRGKSITAETYAAASRHYRYVYSADAGYNFPGADVGCLFRLCNPANVVELAAILDGYTGFRQCLAGNAWGLKTSALPAYPATAQPSLT